CRIYYPRYFFFQAEDGIRDATVTGVQTCALPISEKSSARPKWSARKVRRRQPGTITAYSPAPRCADHSGTRNGPAKARPASVIRSEERRVGKECRGRWGSER